MPSCQIIAPAFPGDDKRLLHDPIHHVPKEFPRDRPCDGRVRPQIPTQDSIWPLHRDPQLHSQRPRDLKAMMCQ